LFYRAVVTFSGPRSGAGHQSGGIWEAEFGTLAGGPADTVQYHATGADTVFHWAGAGVLLDRGQPGTGRSRPGNAA